VNVALKMDLYQKDGVESLLLLGDHGLNLSKRKKSIKTNHQESNIISQYWGKKLRI